jgi:uncharacterized protein YggL (DUF469 family)
MYLRRGCAKLSSQQLREMKRDKDTLREFQALVRSIQKNFEEEVALTAPRKGFTSLVDAREAQSADASGGANLQQKTLIFTESPHTQEYLFQILGLTQFPKKVMLFNGSNKDVKSSGFTSDGLSATPGQSALPAPTRETNALRWWVSSGMRSPS